MPDYVHLKPQVRTKQLFIISQSPQVQQSHKWQMDHRPQDKGKLNHSLFH